ncbi:MAG: cytochrome c [Thermodesulfovibrio sp.]|nr:cytochrome c [Thermodesulfovibrio sp.]MCX7724898.1 cytochrome c [Thermodesulfovibrio sp.]
MLFKWLISFLLIIFASLSLFTMLEIFGKSERRLSMEKLKKLHRFFGKLFFFTFLVGAVVCIYYLNQSKVEFTPRISFHVFSAVAVFLLFSLKMLFVKVYKQFYSYVKPLGVTVALLSFILFSFSTGYSVVTFDKETISNNSSQTETMVAKLPKGDLDSGRKLFNNLCIGCHYPDRKDYKRSAPGLKGLYQEKTLPVSKKPVTDENIINQLRKPIKFMPAFTDLSDKEIADIIAYLKTL